MANLTSDDLLSGLTSPYKTWLCAVCLFLFAWN